MQQVNVFTSHVLLIIEVRIVGIIVGINIIIIVVIVTRRIRIIRTTAIVHL